MQKKLNNERHLTIIACCYNEDKNIKKLYQGIRHAIDASSISEPISWHLLIVDDGSEDNTIATVQALIEQGCRIELLQLTRNFGKEAAITAGLDHTRSASLLIDADLQHPTEVIPKLIEKWLNGADMVVGIPVSRTPDILTQFFSAFYHKLITWSSKSPIIMNAGDFRLISFSSILCLREIRERTRYMKGLYGYVGGKIETIEFEENNRLHGSTNFTHKKRISLAINGIVSTTTFPLRFFTLLGFSILLVAFCYLIYVLMEMMFLGKSVPGFASLLFSIVVLNGLLMIQLGAQSEYIAKILEEVKQRPIYLIKQHIKNDDNK